MGARIWTGDDGYERYGDACDKVDSINCDPLDCHAIALAVGFLTRTYLSTSGEVSTYLWHHIFRLACGN